MLLFAFLLFLDFPVLSTFAPFIAAVADVVLALAPLRLLGGLVVTRVHELELGLALLDKLLSLHDHGSLLLQLLLFQQPLFFGYLAAQCLPLLLLFATDLLLLFVHAAGTSHVVLRLAQQVLALPGLNGSLGEVVLHSISMDAEILEVPVSQAELVDSREHGGQGGLVVAQALGGQFLQHQGNVVQEQGVLGRHPSCPQQNTLALAQPVATEQGSAQVDQDVHLVVPVELAQAVLIHLDGSNILLLLHINVCNVEPHIAKVCGGFTDLGKDVT